MSTNEEEAPKPKKLRSVRRRAPPARNAFAYTIPDAQAMGAPSKSAIYDLAKAGHLKFIEKKPGGSFFSFDRDAVLIGEFATQRQAMRAIPASVGNADDRAVKLVKQ